MFPLGYLDYAAYIASKLIFIKEFSFHTDDVVQSYTKGITYIRQQCTNLLGNGICLRKQKLV